MSETDKQNNASRKGRDAYWAGVPLKDNPMMARDSRMCWERAWLAEERYYRNRLETESRSQSGDRHAHKEQYYTMVDIE